MSAIKLGLSPQPFTVELSTGADFTSSLRYMVSGVATDWPVGTELSLVFDDGAATTWDATVVDELATFDEDKDVADLIDHGTRVKLLYVNDTTERVFFVGTVVRYD